MLVFTLWNQSTHWTFSWMDAILVKNDIFLTNIFTIHSCRSRTDLSSDTKVILLYWAVVLSSILKIRANVLVFCTVNKFLDFCDLLSGMPFVYQLPLYIYLILLSDVKEAVPSWTNATAIVVELKRSGENNLHKNVNTTCTLFEFLERKKFFLNLL